MKVAIIGGGASGMACAISLRRKSKDIEVTVYEKLPRVLKKILVTGNGRCNLTNESSSPECYRGDAELLRPALEKYSYKSTVEFFDSLGLAVRTEAEGRVYPASSQAASVVSVLMNEAETLGVRIITDSPIKSIEAKNGSFVLNGKYTADKLVIAAGGSAAKAQGTDGDSFKLLAALGVKYKTPRPALTGVIIDGFTKSLKGIRNRCEIALFENSNELWRETGEIQFNDYGISGIPVMQLSGLIGENKNAVYSVELDFLPDFDMQYIEGFITRQLSDCPSKSAEVMMTGLVPKALGNYLLLEAGIRKDTALKDIPSANIERLEKIIKNKKYVGLTPRGFEFAQVTAGGVGTDEINPETLELRKHKGIYVTGEALDVDGLCGGHNLQFAWATGRLAADSIAGE